MSLPLIAGGEILGSLNIHARRADMCGATEMALLDELAGDLAYGITALRTRRAREQAEADLLLFRQLTNQSNDAIFVADPESGQFIDVNDTACRGLGYARDELLSLTVFDIDAVFKDVSQWAVHRNVVQAAGAQTLESVHRRKDGTEFPVEASVSYVTREQRGYIVAVIRDITERKQAEDTLKMNEERFRLIAMNSPDIITAQDGALRYTWVVNPIPPHTQDDFIGKTDWDLRPPEEARKLSEVKQSVLDSGESHREEISLCVLGEVHWFDSFFQPVRNEAGEVVGVRHYARDITERKQSEDEIRRQLSELQRWHDVTLGREDRVQEMKREVNELCKRLGEAPRYPSQDAPSTSATVHGRKSANSHGERDTAGRDEIPGMGPELDLSAKRQS